MEEEEEAAVEQEEEEEEEETVFPAELLPGVAVGERLGAGAFGTVFRAVDAAGAACAVKYTHARSPAELQFARRECEMLRELQACPQVVRLLGQAERGSEVVVVLELLPARLLAHLSHASGYSERQAKEILRSVTCAVSFMHGRGVAHLDIKADNVMLRRLAPPEACLIDFGFSVRVEEGVPQRVLVGTPEFQSPEIVRAVPCDPRSCDVWAAGVLAFMLLRGEAPFAHPNRFLLASQIRTFAALDPGRLEGLSPGARAFLAAAIAPLESRLSAKALAASAWLSEQTAGEEAPLAGFAERAAALRRQLEARRLFRVGVAAVLALAGLARRSERVALVTGGNRGLGRALVQRIVAGGDFATVLFSSRVPCAIPGAVCVEAGDFAEPENVRALAARVLAAHGRVDALVNNAGEMLHPEQPFLEASAGDMQHSFAVNTVAPMLLMQAFLPGMISRKWGAIVNVSSGQGAMNEMGPGHPAYRCSKVSSVPAPLNSIHSFPPSQAALNAATLVAAAEHGGCVRINAVCPGFVRTDLTRHLPGDMAEPEEAAEQIVWLLGEDAPTGGFWRNGEGIYW